MQRSKLYSISISSSARTGRTPQAVLHNGGPRVLEGLLDFVRTDPFRVYYPDVAGRTRSPKSMLPRACTCNRMGPYRSCGDTSQAANVLAALDWGRAIPIAAGTFIRH